MKILSLTEASAVYTSNVYLLLGEWNTMDDVNTLVDVGRDVSVIDEINDAPTGVGKKRIEQVVLTHCHYDHAEILPVIKKMFNPTVCAFSEFQKGIDVVLKDGQKVKMADHMFEVIHVPAHSNDSICLFCEEAGVLFAGDTALDIKSPDVNCDPAFISVLQRLCGKRINSIYFGHGKPMLNGCNEMLSRTLKNVTMYCKKEFFV